MKLQNYKWLTTYLADLQYLALYHYKVQTYDKKDPKYELSTK